MNTSGATVFTLPANGLCVKTDFCLTELVRHTMYVLTFLAAIGSGAFCVCQHPEKKKTPCKMTRVDYLGGGSDGARMAAPGWRARHDQISTDSQFFALNFEPCDRSAIHSTCPRCFGMARAAQLKIQMIERLQLAHRWGQYLLAIGPWSCKCSDKEENRNCGLDSTAHTTRNLLTKMRRSKREDIVAHRHACPFEKKQNVRNATAIRVAMEVANW